jgi:hypothetical protein
VSGTSNRNHPGFRPLRRERHDDGDKRGVCMHEWPNAIDVFDAILKDGHDGVAVDEALEPRTCILALVRFHAEQHDVGRGEVVVDTQTGDRNVDHTVGIRDVQRIDRGATSDEGRFARSNGDRCGHGTTNCTGSDHNTCASLFVHARSCHGRETLGFSWTSRDTIRKVSGEDAESKPEVRLSNAEREVIVDRLKVAQDEGRIDLLEFEDRVGRVYAAKVGSEIVGVLDDLPAVQPPPPQPAPQYAAPMPPATAAVEVEAFAVRRQRWMFSVLSSRQSRGRWTPGEPNKTLTVLGSQTLDLTEIDALDVEIRAYTMLGETKIIVPPGAQVDLDGFIFLGETTNKTHNDEGESRMRVRVRSYGLLGECTVRTPGTRDALKRAFKRRMRELE